MNKLKQTWYKLDSIEIFGATCLIVLFGWGIYGTIIAAIERFF